jgi:hypothetical protein
MPFTFGVFFPFTFNLNLLQCGGPPKLYLLNPIQPKLQKSLTMNAIVNSIHKELAKGLYIPSSPRHQCHHLAHTKMHTFLGCLNFSHLNRSINIFFLHQNLYELLPMSLITISWSVFTPLFFYQPPSLTFHRNCDLVFYKLICERIVQILKGHFQGLLNALSNSLASSL